LRNPETTDRSTHSMLAPSSPDRIQIAYDDDRLVDHAGLLLPTTLADRPAA